MRSFIHSPAASLAMFVAFSLVQAVVFMLAPEVHMRPPFAPIFGCDISLAILASFAPDLDRAPYLYFRLIGAKEIGLMIMYCTFIQSRSRALMMMTVLGRFSTIPMLIWFVFGKGGPRSLLFGCVLDITFASWTLFALLRQGGEVIFDFPLPSTMRELVARVCFCACGMVELFGGALILADQMMQSELGASWSPVAQLNPKEGDLQLGLCSFAFMTCIIGCYQILISARTAPSSVLMAVAAHHAIFPCLVFWLAQDSKVSSLRASPFHWPCAAVAAASAMLLPIKAQSAKVTKRE